MELTHTRLFHIQWLDFHSARLVARVEGTQPGVCCLWQRERSLGHPTHLPRINNGDAMYVVLSGPSQGSPVGGMPMSPMHQE